METASLGSPTWAKWTILVVLVWQFAGLAMVFYLAGLQSIPKLRGKRGRRRLERVSTQTSRPAAPRAGDHDLVHLHLDRRPARLRPGDRDDGEGPVKRETLATVYKQTWDYGRFGYGAALALVLSVLIAIVTAHSSSSSAHERNESNGAQPVQPEDGRARDHVDRYRGDLVAAHLLHGHRSLKPASQIFGPPFALPNPVTTHAYGQAWKGSGNGTLGRALQNSLIITIASVLVLIVLGSLAAYVIARGDRRRERPLRPLRSMGSSSRTSSRSSPSTRLPAPRPRRNYPGMIVLYTGLLLPLTVFLYASFVRALPRDYEEAARVDGAVPRGCSSESSSRSCGR